MQLLRVAFARGAGARTLATQARPSNISELQAHFNKYPSLHGADNPTYLKKGSADVVMTSAALGGCAIGTLMVLGGLVNMSLGINKTR